MFGKNRLQRSFRKYILKGEASITGKLLDDLGKFSGSDRFDDDVTLLLLEF
jgi:serine phosphatase RsbU (regulator of sigma subunit)